MSEYNGYIVIDKPEGMGSTDVVRKIKKIFNQKKVGHSGTLDPLATGVLVVALGKATKTIEYLQTQNKTYIARMNFGKKTDTLDIEGKIIATSDNKVDREDIESIVPKYIGDITQIPPMYSALKVNGKRLYELARDGIEIERESRKTTIYSLKILDFSYENQTCDIEVECSAGTYIRTLIDDIGEDLGAYAYMAELRRIKCSGFSIYDSISLDNADEIILDKFLDISKMPSIYRDLIVDDEVVSRILNGMTVNINTDYEDNKYIVKSEDKLIGIGNLFSSKKGKMLKLEKHLYDNEDN